MQWIRQARGQGFLIVGHTLDGEAIPVGRYAVPAQFVVVVDDPKLDVVIALEVYVTPLRTIACFEIDAIQRPGAPPVSIDTLRSITIKSYIDDAFEHLVGFERDDTRGISSELAEDTDEWRTEARRDLAWSPTSRTLKEKLADAKRAAEIYEINIHRGNPTHAVAAELGVSRSTAIRRVALAIEKGFASDAVKAHRLAAKTRAQGKGESDG